MESWPQWYRHYWLIIISAPLAVIALANFVHSRCAVGRRTVKPK